VHLAAYLSEILLKFSSNAGHITSQFFEG